MDLVFDSHEVLEVYAMSMLCAASFRCIHKASLDWEEPAE